MTLEQKQTGTKYRRLRSLVAMAAIIAGSLSLAGCVVEAHDGYWHDHYYWHHY